jgi:hypothetical protein
MARAEQRFQAAQLLHHPQSCGRGTISLSLNNSLNGDAERCHKVIALHTTNLLSMADMHNSDYIAAKIIPEFKPMPAFLVEWQRSCVSLD